MRSCRRARPWKPLSRFTRATRRPRPCAGWATPSWRSGGMLRRRRPSHLRMRAPARLPARIGTTPRQGWPGSRWRRATPRLRCRRWSRCWRSAQRPAPMTTRSKAWNSRAWSSGPVTGCWRARASRRPARRRVAGPRARGASGPGGDHRRRRASPGLHLQHPGSPRDRGGVGGAGRRASVAILAGRDHR